MNRSLLRFHRTERGVSMIELLVALAIFALFIFMIDALFSSARTNARKTEIAADVQQNARIAVDRLTRELREAHVYAAGDPLPAAAYLVVDTSQGPGRHGILFKSARLAGTATFFCLYVRTSVEPFYSSACFDGFTTVGGSAIPKPSSAAPYTYSGPPYPLCPPNTNVNILAPCGSYQPIWQQYVGYFVVENPLLSGLFELHRVSGQLNSPTQTLVPSNLLTGGDVIATMVDTFDVCVNFSNPPACTDPANGVVAVALKAKGSEKVQGRAIPDQQIDLPGGSLSRN